VGHLVIVIVLFQKYRFFLFRA